MASASAPALPSGATRPPPVCRMISPQPESSATTTGVPTSSASSGTRPKISSADGYTTTSASASASRRNSAGSSPVKVTRSATPRTRA